MRDGVSVTRLLPAGLLAALLAAPASLPAAVFTVPGLSESAVVQGLAAPTDFDWLPDGRMLVLEKAGTVRMVEPGSAQPTLALDWTTFTESTSERGLLGLCVDPGFSGNGFVYLYYTTRAPKNRISRFHVVGNSLDPTSEVVLLDGIDSTNGNHNGGCLRIGPDGKLWAAPGDSGTGGAKSQDLSTGQFSGKVLRLNLDGSVPADNPFVGLLGVEPRIFAYGFRNPFRFGFRPAPNAALYVGDVGQSAREEIDVLAIPGGSPPGGGGGDYGWPCREGLIAYAGAPGVACTPPLVDPAFDYDRTVGQAITGGAFVTSAAYPPALQGKYVFGDFVAGWLRALDFDAAHRVVGTLQGVATGAEGPVSIRVGPDGLLYWAALNSGRIYRVNPPQADFFTLSPCRAVDTRGPSAPALSPLARRSFAVAGSCAVPAGARAVAVTVTAVLPAADGYLTLFPGDQAVVPSSSALNFRAGQVRASSAVVSLGADGTLGVASGAAAAVDVVVDVTGYFR